MYWLPSSSIYSWLPLLWSSATDSPRLPINFLLDGNLFNIRRLQAKTKVSRDTIFDLQYADDAALFHDLLRLPILHHYVWSELTGHNSLQNIVDLPTPTHFALRKITCRPYVLYSNLYCGVSVIYCHCQIQLLSIGITCRLVS